MVEKLSSKLSSMLPMERQRLSWGPRHPWKISRFSETTMMDKNMRSTCVHVCVWAPECLSQR